MTSNTKDRIVELAIQLHDSLLEYEDEEKEKYKIEVSYDDYYAIKKFDDALTELHQIIVEQKL